MHNHTSRHFQYIQEVIIIWQHRCPHHVAQMANKTCNVDHLWNKIIFNIKQSPAKSMNSFLKSMSSQYTCGNITMADELNKFTLLNSLAPGRFEFNFRLVIFKLILVNGGWGICYQIALTWMPLDLADDMSTLVQVMAWCRQATSHYLSQCWPRSMPPNGVTRPQWVKHNHELPNQYMLHISQHE